VRAIWNVLTWPIEWVLGKAEDYVLDQVCRGLNGDGVGGKG